jgi:hypothetical protein
MLTYLLCFGKGHIHSVLAKVWRGKNGTVGAGGGLARVAGVIWTPELGSRECIETQTEEGREGIKYPEERNIYSLSAGV